mgnify:CR=1 FL=1
MKSYSVPDPLGDGVVEVLVESDLGHELSRRGKVRDIYSLGEELLIVTTDRISAFDVVLRTPIPHKGESLNKLSSYWFSRSKRIFPNHFLEMFDDRTMRVSKAERIDIEWVCRAYLYGSAWRAYKSGVRTISGVRLPSGLSMAEELPEVILTPTIKADIGHDREISKSEAIDSKLLDREEWNRLEEASYKLYEFYKSEAERRGIIIPDFKLEFGRTKDGLIQIDEPPTHDSARFWAAKFYQPGVPQEARCLDKEFLREFLRKIGYSGEGPPPEIPRIAVREVSKRCIASYEVLSGMKTLQDFNLASVDEVIEELKI